MAEKIYNQFIADIYDISPYFGKGRELIITNYISIFKKYQIKKVLEVGTSTGLLTEVMIKNSIYVDTVDISLEMQNKAKKRISNYPKNLREKVNFINEDINNFISKKKYDAIILADSIFFLAEIDKENLLNKCYKLLKTNGIIIFDFFKKSLNNNISCNKEMTRLKCNNGKYYIIIVEHNNDILKKTHSCNFSYIPVKNYGESIINFKICYNYLTKEEVESYFKKYNFKVEIIEETFGGYQIFMVVKKVNKGDSDV